MYIVYVPNDWNQAVNKKTKQNRMDVKCKMENHVPTKPINDLFCMQRMSYKIW